MAKTKFDSFHAYLVKDAVFDGEWEIPRIESNVVAVPQNLVPFTKISKTDDVNQWVHFYTDDRRFEVLWNNPKKYLALLKKFDGVISPDYSLYIDLPLSMQVWNVYRSHAIAHWLTTNGISVIPNVRWGDERSYKFCFDGIVHGGIVAVGSHGCIRNSTNRQYFERGLEEMNRRLRPHTILVYGLAPDSIFLKYVKAGVKIIAFPSEMSRAHKIKATWGVA